MNRVLVGMSEEEQHVYDQMKEQLSVQIKGKEIDAVNAAALSGKLCQMANGAIYGEDKRAIHLHDQKLDAISSIITILTMNDARQNSANNEKSISCAMARVLVSMNLCSPVGPRVVIVAL